MRDVARKATLANSCSGDKNKKKRRTFQLTCSTNFTRTQWHEQYTQGTTCHGIHRVEYKSNIRHATCYILYSILLHGICSTVQGAESVVFAATGRTEENTPSRVA